MRRGFVGSQAGIHGLTAAAHSEGALVPICKVPGIGNGTSSLVNGQAGEVS